MSSRTGVVLGTLIVLIVLGTSALAPGFAQECGGTSCRSPFGDCLPFLVHPSCLESQVGAPCQFAGGSAGVCVNICEPNLDSCCVQVPCHCSGAGPGSGRVSQLTLRKAGSTSDDLILSWGRSCFDTDVDYAVYEGIVGSYASHTVVTCSTARALTWTVSPSPGRTYYLVVPISVFGSIEGSYGLSSSGTERPRAELPCQPFQQVVPCPANPIPGCQEMSPHSMNPSSLIPTK